MKDNTTHFTPLKTASRVAKNCPSAALYSPDGLPFVLGQFNGQLTGIKTLSPNRVFRNFRGMGLTGSNLGRSTVFNQPVAGLRKSGLQTRGNSILKEVAA